MVTFKRIKRGLKNPIAAGRYVLKSIVHKRYKWSKVEGFQKKVYKTYADYLRHQKEKLNLVKPWLENYDVEYRKALTARLATNVVVQPGMKVLCLAARLGTEVKSFHDIGCFAYGIDLNPGVGNEYVVTGDFHDIKTPDFSVDLVFSNSLDHGFDLDKIIKEVRRVLSPGGVVVLELMKGVEEGVEDEYYASLLWDRTGDVIEAFVGAGFEQVSCVDISFPWNGTHVTLKKL